MSNKKTSKLIDALMRLLQQDFQNNNEYLVFIHYQDYIVK